MQAAVGYLRVSTREQGRERGLHRATLLPSLLAIRDCRHGREDTRRAALIMLRSDPRADSLSKSDSDRSRAILCHSRKQADFLHTGGSLTDRAEPIPA